VNWGCSDFDPDRYLPTSPDTQEALVLAPEKTSVRADGGSRIRIEARINPGSTARKITFTTTMGKLIAGDRSVEASATGLDVDADVTGVAAVELQADVQPGTARVTASIDVPNTNPVQTLTRTIDVQFTAVGPGEIITLTATPASAQADGATHIRLVATVATTLPAGGREVTFTTTSGEFVHGEGTEKAMVTVKADASNTAEAELIAPRNPGRVGVTAVVSNFSARTDITFDRATPDVIFVEVAASSLTLMGASAKVTVTLLRDIGQVSNNTAVTFEATDAAGQKIGTFSEISLAKEDPSDTHEFKDVTATAMFDPDDTAAPGVATITARVGSKSGSVPITLK
jgi:hypothetical protein